MAGQEPGQAERVFESGTPFDPERIHAAALTCSDGRWGEQVDEFLHRALGLPRYDRLAVPGGGASLAGHLTAFREEAAVEEQLRFLIRVHGLERVILVAHQDCAFYALHLAVPPKDLKARQLEDLSRAAARVRRLKPGLEVEAFFASRGGGTAVWFDRVPV